MNEFCKKISLGYQPNFHEFIDELGDYFPLLKELVNTEQDPDWHAEGNVFIHMTMVMNELYSLINLRKEKFTPDRLLALVLGTALHDIGKPLTTRKMEIRGVDRIAAPQHEYRGGSYITYRLLELKLPYSIVKNIIGLVIYHITPKLLVVKNFGQSHYFKLSRLADIELLYYLEKADMVGRACQDKQKQIEYIELFKLFSEEYGVWPNRSPYQGWEKIIAEKFPRYDDKTRRFILMSIIKDIEAGTITMLEEGIARSYSLNEHFSELIILSGPSGSGKSTWAKKHLPDYEIISLDELRKEITGKETDQSKNSQVLQSAKKRLKIHLAKKKNVVWDSTNLRKDFRNQIAEIGYAYQALVTITFFLQPVLTLYQKNNNRTINVSDHILTKQLDSFEWPERSESHLFKVIDENGNQYND